jgi:hypothetical protein
MTVYEMRVKLHTEIGYPALQKGGPPRRSSC